MRTIIKKQQKEKLRTIYQIASAVLCIAAIVYFMPRNRVFNYNFSINTPWSYGQIIAEFDFPIYKSDERLQSESDSLRKHFEPYFIKDKSTLDKMLKSFEEQYYGRYSQLITPAQYQAYRNKLTAIYERGIISSEDADRVANGKTKFIKLITDNISSGYSIDDFLKKPDAYKTLTARDTIPHTVVNRLHLNEFLHANIIYDSVRTAGLLNEELNKLSISDGIVQKGQKIISRGEIVDSKTHQILQSYQYELEKRRNENNKTTIMLIGQIIFVTMCIFSLIAYLFIYCQDIYSNNNKFMLVLLSATIFPIIVGMMMQAYIGNVFILPFAMVPMLLCLFTSKRTAIITHYTCIILCSIMLTSPYEFLLLQVAAGHAAVLSMRELSSRSQMFRCVFYIFLSYALSYLCYEFIVENDITKLNPLMYIYFVINAILMLFAYPMMFIIEKLFGFVSNVTLIELSNINSELLRKLSQDAPGTFQHSMQVGNLAAEAARKIGANTLEVRTGALYHDIGKILNPIYFTENQSGGISPHSNLSLQESASIIIKHVTDGISLAEKHHLPNSIKNFIATHHGAGKTGYFYITYKNEHPGEDIDEKAFTYPGPKPTTKEQAILMLADCVEAASHSISEYTDENIENLVDKIADAKLAEGELSITPLTFKEIDIIKNSFKERLKAIYHTRISYPSEKETNKPADK